MDAEVERIVAIAPNLLQPVLNIDGQAISIRFRGLEVASVTENETTYPLGEPLEPLLESLGRERRYGSRHPLARAHEEAWLESNRIAQIRDVLPVGGMRSTRKSPVSEVKSEDNRSPDHHR